MIDEKMTILSFASEPLSGKHASSSAAAAASATSSAGLCRAPPGPRLGPAPSTVKTKKQQTTTDSNINEYRSPLS